MPYRVDIDVMPADAVDVLVELGALDVEAAGDGMAAILPDGLRPEAVAGALGLAVSRVAVSEARGRDDGSVWLVRPRELWVGGVAMRMVDSQAFGSGHHSTTALCLDIVEELISRERVGSMLDVGTGSGILAIAALMLGVPQAVGLDIEDGALETAAENARLNQLADRLRLIPGGPEAVDGKWPLVVANVLAAPLIDMAPILVQRLGSGGRLVLSGIHGSLEAEVRRAYQRCGLRHRESRTRDGWSAVVLQASW